MKLLAICCLLLGSCARAWGGQIICGMSEAHLLVWRYWEKTDTGFACKMFVLNTTGQDLTFRLQRLVFRDVPGTSALTEDSSKAGELIPPRTIRGGGFTVCPVPPALGPSEVMRFLVNGKEEGLLPLMDRQPPAALQGFRIVSDEGINGRWMDYWFAKSSVVASGGKEDTLRLLFNYHEQPRYPRNGIRYVRIKPADSLTGSFRILDQRAFRDSSGYYGLELPFRAEASTPGRYIPSNPPLEVLIAFTSRKLDGIIVPIQAISGVDLLEKEAVSGSLKRKYGSRTWLQLPVIIRP